MITRLDAGAADFDARLETLLAFDEADDARIKTVVAEVIADVRARGDAAVIEYTNRFDNRAVAAAGELELGELDSYRTAIAPEVLEALTGAAERIRRYHERQRQESWRYQEADGTVLGQQITPLDRAGVYVPGGKAAYPSSVLMNTIPARVAGVSEVIMTVPAPGGELNPLVMAAAAVAGVDRVFTIGGAQAVAALAYGTERIPAVDKIVGPGNAYVVAAKAMVFGKVGIDMIAGPSEILVVCDGGTDPDWIAYDLFSQAEHDEMAQAILLSTDEAFLDRVQQSIDKLLDGMERADIIRQSLSARGAPQTSAS